MDVKIIGTLNEGLNWERNWIQFPRLIRSMVLTQSLDVPAIAEHLDLSLTQVYALIKRADDEMARVQEMRHG